MLDADENASFAALVRMERALLDVGYRSDSGREAELRHAGNIRPTSDTLHPFPGERDPCVANGPPSRREGPVLSQARIMEPRRGLVRMVAVNSFVDWVRQSPAKSGTGPATAATGTAEARAAALDS